MSIKAGLVGLPNVGKSTLFNALTKSQIPAENYPFCTIDPHVAITEVPDQRIDKLRALYRSEKTIPATVTFVDIAGLVKGAAAGEGLGNQFLSHIREVDLILHVLRCFEDSNIVHTQDKLDPLSDFRTIVDELMLKDMDSVDKRLEKLPKLIKTAKGPEQKTLIQEQELLEQVKKGLDAGDAQKVRATMAQASVDTLPLLSAKNFLVIANIGEQELDSYDQNPHYQSLVKHFGAERVIPVSAKIEHEIAQMEPEQAQEMMEMLSITEPGLNKVIRATFNQLGLITFFTCGPREIHAWPIKKGIPIRQAAGEIHSDLEKGFISSDVFNCEDLFSAGSEQKLKDLGKIRKEGQGYIMRDGDVIHVFFNV